MCLFFLNRPYLFCSLIPNVVGTTERNLAISFVFHFYRFKSSDKYLLELTVVWIAMLLLWTVTKLEHYSNTNHKRDLAKNRLIRARDLSSDQFQPSVWRRVP